MALDPALQAFLDAKRRREREELLAQLAQDQAIQARGVLDTSEFDASVEANRRAAEQASQPRSSGIAKGLLGLSGAGGGDGSLLGGLAAGADTLGLAGPQGVLDSVQTARAGINSQIAEATSFLDPAREAASGFRNQVSDAVTDATGFLDPVRDVQASLQGQPVSLGASESEESSDAGDIFGSIGRGITAGARGVGEFRSAIRGQTSLSSRQEAQDIQNEFNRFMQNEALYKTFQKEITPLVTNLDGDEQAAALDKKVEEFGERFGPNARTAARAVASSPHVLSQIDSLGEVLKDNPVAQAAYRAGDKEFSSYMQGEHFAQRLFKSPKVQAELKALRGKKSALIKNLESEGSPRSLEIAEGLRSGTGTVDDIREGQNTQKDGAALVGTNDAGFFDNSQLSLANTYSDSLNFTESKQGRRDRVARQKADEQLARDFVKAREIGPRISVLDTQTNETLLLNQNDPRLNKDPGRFKRVPPVRRTEEGGPGAFAPAIDLGRRNRGEQAKFQGEATFRESSASNMIDELGKLGPGLVGFKGAIADGTAGITEQIFSRDFSEKLNRWITASQRNPNGVDARTLAAFRVKARAFIARSVPEISGEKSGRITAAELALTEAALKILDPTASASQIEGALSAVLQLNLLEQDLNHALSGDPNFGENDLNTQTGWLQQVKDLKNVKFSSDPATDRQLRAQTVNELRRQRNSMNALAGGAHAYKLERQERAREFNR